MPETGVCHSCGASVDPMAPECDNCGTPVADPLDEDLEDLDEDLDDEEDAKKPEDEDEL